MPYVECPSCAKTSYIVAARNTVELCPNCGDGLPVRRKVVSRIAAQARVASAEASPQRKAATA